MGTPAVFWGGGTLRDDRECPTSLSDPREALMPVHRVGAAIAVAAAAILAGCSSTASQPPSAPADLPSASPAPSVATSAPTATASAVAPSPAPSALPSASSIALSQALRGGAWQIVSATGITDVARLSPVEFREALVVGTGVCGFASDLSYPGANAIDIAELYWDAVICKDNDPADSRSALKAILDAVDAGTVKSDGSVVLSGPSGEVVLRR